MGADRIFFSNDYPYEDYAEGGEFMDTTDQRKRPSQDRARQRQGALHAIAVPSIAAVSPM
jgi:predicted TIM-barrel fold metal-dependent hydrolase